MGLRTGSAADKNNGGGAEAMPTMTRNTPYWLVGLATLLLLLAGELWLEWELNGNHHTEQRLETLSRVSTLAARLQGTVSTNLNLVNGLASAMGVTGELSEEQFNFVAGQIMDRPNQIRNLAIAPGFTVNHIYPLEGNEAAIGLNLLQHPVQRKAALLSRDTGQFVLAGPLKLVQGGMALIGRLPYYRPVDGDPTSSEFAGLVSGVIDIEQLYREVSLTQFEQDIDIAIRRRNADATEGVVFYGEAALFDARPVSASARFSSASEWEIAAVPRGGWSEASPLLPATRLTFAVITVLLGWLLIFKNRVTARLLRSNASLESEIQVRKAVEEELSRSEQRYRDITESMADWVWEVDREGRYTFASGNVEEILGYTPDELLGRSPFEFMPEDEAERVKAIFAGIIGNREPIVDLENWNVGHNGEAVCLLTNGVPIVEQGEFLGYRGIDKDITREKHAEAIFRQQQDELRRKQQQLEGLIENAPAVVYLKDPTGRYTMVNRRYAELLGVEPDDILGKTDFELHPEPVAQLLVENDSKVMLSGESARFEETLQQGESVLVYESIKFPLFDKQHQPYALCGISADITERKRNENNLQLFKKVVESANEAVVITDLDGLITHINPAYEAITGYSEAEVIGNTPGLVRSDRHDAEFYQKMWHSIHSEGHWEGEIWDRRRNGELFPKWLSINTVYDANGEPVNHVGIFTDITEKKQTEERLLNLAYYDPLTQLPNRSLFQERLEHDIAACRRHGKKLAVLFIDLDRFKYINDTFGHIAGDQLLATMAERVKAEIRESDTVARLGGDEFTVILSEIHSAGDASSVADGIVDALYRPFAIQENEIRVGGSVGIAIFPDDGEDYDALSKKADMAMYQAKSHGRNNYQFFSAEMNRYVTERVAVEGELHQAIENREFQVYYQPKYHFTDERLSGMEALVRWNHPTLGLVPPDRFIPIAEDSGLILPIGQQVLEQACAQVAEWSREYGDTPHIAINLSAKQFRQKDLIAVTEAVLEQSGLRPEQVEMEITESTIVGDVDAAINTMQRLRDLGLSLAIDDFGTGYSSLNYLKRFPVNTLKIDRSFIRDITINANDAAIVRAIIALAHSLDLKVVAEGVETREQLEYLGKEGCHEAQGYYFSRPVPADEMATLLKVG